jgi:dTDP-L-rhamnose 4-epimerase
VEHSVNQKNVLVTGGAGFLGCALSQRLAPHCNRFLVVDNLLSQIHPLQARPEKLHPKAELLVADVANADSWSNLFCQFRPEIVLHLAAETGTGQSLRGASKHVSTNVLGLTRLLDALVEHEIFPEQIILPSSRAVYGEGAWQRSDGTIFYPGQRTNAQLAQAKWNYEGAPLASYCGKTRENPTSVYGATKLAQENVLKSWAFSFGVPLSILRLQNVYGPGQSPFNPYTGVVVLFSRLAKGKGVIELYEDGLITRDFVFIDDVIDAIFKAILAVPESGYRQLDIGSGTSTTLLAVAEMISDMHGAPPAVISGKYRNGDVRHASCDISASARELNWQPKWSLIDGLKRLQEFLSESGLPEVLSV